MVCINLIRDTLKQNQISPWSHLGHHVTLFRLLQSYKDQIVQFVLLQVVKTSLLLCLVEPQQHGLNRITSFSSFSVSLPHYLVAHINSRFEPTGLQVELLHSRRPGQQQRQLLLDAHRLNGQRQTDS